MIGPPTDYPVLHNAMTKTHRQNWFVWNTIFVYRLQDSIDLTVDVEDEGVLDTL